MKLMPVIPTRFIAAVLALAALGSAVRAEQAPTSRPAGRGPQLPAGIAAARDVAYGDAPGVANKLDVFWAEKAEGKLPLIVWVHGGGWEGGDKAGCPAMGMVPRGYVVASINYRFSQEAIYPAQIEDCKGAIRFLRAHAAEYHIDPDKVGVWGASAGGHLVALLGTTGGENAKDIEGTVGGNAEQSSRVQAVCDWFGPTDMSQFFQQAGTENIFKPTPKHSPISRLFGGPVEEKKDLVAKANPITFITRDAAPFLIMHGDKDPLVPLAQSRILAEALKAANVECHLEVLAGAGHGTGFNRPEVPKMLTDFFDKHLNPTATPLPEK
jgi:acetyl esterase/lipase